MLARSDPKQRYQRDMQELYSEPQLGMDDGDTTVLGEDEVGDHTQLQEETDFTHTRIVELIRERFQPGELLEFLDVAAEYATRARARACTWACAPIICTWLRACIAQPDGRSSAAAARARAAARTSHLKTSHAPSRAWWRTATWPTTPRTTISGW